MNISFEEFEQKLKEAITEAKQQGWRIQKALFYNKDRRLCCPLGAIMVVNNLNDTNELRSFLETKFNITHPDMTSFWYGFDGIWTDSTTVLKFYELGRKFKKDFLNA